MHQREIGYFNNAGKQQTPGKGVGAGDGLQLLHSGPQYTLLKEWLFQINTGSCTGDQEETETNIRYSNTVFQPLFHFLLQNLQSLIQD